MLSKVTPFTKANGYYEAGSYAQGKVVDFLIYVTGTRIGRANLSQRVLHVILERRTGTVNVRNGAIVVDLTQAVLLQLDFHRIHARGAGSRTFEKDIVPIVLCGAVADLRGYLGTEHLVEVIR